MFQWYSKINIRYHLVKLDFQILRIKENRKKTHQGKKVVRVSDAGGASTTLAKTHQWLVRLVESCTQHTLCATHSFLCYLFFSKIIYYKWATGFTDQKTLYMPYILEYLRTLKTLIFSYSQIHKHIL